MGPSYIAQSVWQADAESASGREDRRGLGKRILISHDSKHDGAFALRLADALRGIGAEPRLENLRAVCGERDFERLRLALSSGYDHMIPLLSETYLTDDFLVDELWAATVLDENTKRGFLLPAITGDGQMAVPTGLRPRATDFRSMRFEDAFSELTEPLLRSRHVLVIMAVGDAELERVYKAAIEPAIQQAGFSPNRLQGCAGTEEIRSRVLSEIDRSALVFVDLSGQRLNGFFELGYALAKDKEVIVALRAGERLPFNLGRHRILKWHDPEELHDELLRRFSEVSETLSARTACDCCRLTGWGEETTTACAHGSLRARA